MRVCGPVATAAIIAKVDLSQYPGILFVFCNLSSGEYDVIGMPTALFAPENDADSLGGTIMNLP